MRPRFVDVPALVVDDSGFVRTQVRDMLAQVGLKSVTSVGDVQSALVALHRFSPRIILLDWYLPDHNASTLLHVLRDPGTSAYPDVPVVLMSGLPTRQLVDEAAGFGIVHLLRKPFSPRQLWQRLAAVPLQSVADAASLAADDRVAVARGA
ncbi:MAG: response regulator [Alsobacter sp.]